MSHVIIQYQRPSVGLGYGDRIAQSTRPDTNLLTGAPGSVPTTSTTELDPTHALIAHIVEELERGAYTSD